MNYDCFKRQQVIAEKATTNFNVTPEWEAFQRGLERIRNGVGNVQFIHPSSLFIISRNKELTVERILGVFCRANLTYNVLSGLILNYLV